MNLAVSPNAQGPMYRQIYEQIAGQILSGALRAGAALPPIRTVAAELRIRIITSKRAWEERGRDGYIESIPGSGCYVRSVQSDQRREKLHRRIEADIAYYRSLGLEKQEVLGLLDALWEEEP